MIFDTENGVQFTPTVNGAIGEEAEEESVLAAKISLESPVLDGDVLYFLNESLAESLWIVEHCTFVTVIGRHSFYRE